MSLSLAGSESAFVYSGEHIKKRTPSSGMLGVWDAFAVIVAVVSFTDIPAMFWFVDPLERSTFFVARPSPPVDLADPRSYPPLPVGRTFSASSARPLVVRCPYFQTLWLSIPVRAFL